MTTTQNTVDEILAAVYIAGISNGLHRDIRDADEINHRREAFIKANPMNREAKQALLTGMLELVGSNTQGVIRTGGIVDHKQEKYRNAVKDEIRQALKKEFGDE